MLSSYWTPTVVFVCQLSVVAVRGCPRRSRLTHAPFVAASYHDPPPHADLNDGFPERYRVKDDGTEQGGMSLRGCLRSLTDNQVDLGGISVVSFRNNFNKIMGTPYNEAAIGPRS